MGALREDVHMESMIAMEFHAYSNTLLSAHTFLFTYFHLTTIIFTILCRVVKKTTIPISNYRGSNKEEVELKFIN